MANKSIPGESLSLQYLNNRNFKLTWQIISSCLESRHLNFVNWSVPFFREEPVQLHIALARPNPEATSKPVLELSLEKRY